MLGHLPQVISRPFEFGFAFYDLNCRALFIINKKIETRREICILALSYSLTCSSSYQHRMILINVSGKGPH
jgi:hypothetical protein